MGEKNIITTGYHRRIKDIRHVYKFCMPRR